MAPRRASLIGVWLAVAASPALAQGTPAKLPGDPNLLQLAAPVHAGKHNAVGERGAPPVGRGNQAACHRIASPKEQAIEIESAEHCSAATASHANWVGRSTAPPLC